VKTTESYGSAAVQRIMIDVQISAAIARFFAERFRAACWAELFIATKATTLIEPVIDHARRSVMAWQVAADVSRDIYHDDLTYGPQSWLRGSWQSRLPEMTSEVLDLESLRGAGKFETVQADEQVLAAVRALKARQPVIASRSGVSAPSKFKAGEAITVRIDETVDDEPVLHYRHVNQAERWNSAKMTRNGNGFAATIPGEYTDSKFHLQFFVSSRRGGRSVLSPGLEDNLSNEPYYTALQD
jgi:hypothetical protein